MTAPVGAVARARNLLREGRFGKLGMETGSAVKAEFPLVLCARLAAWLRYLAMVRMVAGAVQSAAVFDPVGEIF